MAKIQIVKPEITRISFRQEKGDPEYGTCLWADFDFDTKNYTLQIMSDCGNYSYGWVPTPKSETFFQLCKRFEAGYLIYKLADKTQINEEATYNAVVELLRYDDLPGGWQNEIKESLWGCCNEQECVDVIFDFVRNNDITVDDYSVWRCIEKDYTANAKKIIDVYMRHIIPAIPEEAEGVE